MKVDFNEVTSVVECKVRILVPFGSLGQVSRLLAFGEARCDCSAADADLIGNRPHFQPQTTFGNRGIGGEQPPAPRREAAAPLENDFRRRYAALQHSQDAEVLFQRFKSSLVELPWHDTCSAHAGKFADQGFERICVLRCVVVACDEFGDALVKQSEVWAVLSLLDGWHPIAEAGAAHIGGGDEQNALDAYGVQETQPLKSGRGPSWRRSLRCDVCLAALWIVKAG